MLYYFNKYDARRVTPIIFSQCPVFGQDFVLIYRTRLRSILKQKINTAIMEKFMMIIREDLARMRHLTDEERFSNIPMMLRWVDSLIETGNYIKGEPLLIKGRYVSKDQILSDGPFIEAREGISGYEIIWAENIEQAAAIAQTCPLVQQGLAVREVRPIATIYSVNNE
jgi:hypothetical protein